MCLILMLPGICNNFVFAAMQTQCFLIIADLDFISVCMRKNGGGKWKRRKLPAAKLHEPECQVLYDFITEFSEVYSMQGRYIISISLIFYDFIKPFVLGLGEKFAAFSSLPTTCTFLPKLIGCTLGQMHKGEMSPMPFSYEPIFGGSRGNWCEHTIL